MKRTTRDYYADLRQGYSKKIRQLVPRYDEMVQCIIELLQLCSPRTLLDIGAGTGNVAAIALGSIPGVRVTAVEASDEMVEEARRLLGSSGDRVEIVHQDILDFAPEDRFDAIISNLVLHNIPLEKKRRLLGTLLDWLEPGGVFIWGDLILHPDEQVKRHFVEYRKAFAQVAGCPDELIGQNFHKEGSEDHPLTIEETVKEAKEAGFRHAFPVWAHDTFAIFFLKRGQ